jgi:hypothetical protein
MISSGTGVDVSGGNDFCFIKVSSSPFDTYARGLGQLEKSKLTSLSLRVVSVEGEKAFLRVYPHIQLSSNLARGLGPTGSDGELFVVDLTAITRGESVRASFVSPGGLWKTMPSVRLTEYSSYLDFLSSMNLFVPRGFSQRFVKTNRGEFYIKLGKASVELQSRLKKYLKVSEEKPSFGTLLYFSGVTIATIGYGDIYPRSDIARFLVFLEALIGVILIGYMTTRLYDFFKSKRDLDIQEDKDRAILKSAKMLLDPFFDKFLEDKGLMLKSMQAGDGERISFMFSDLANMYKNVTPHTIGALTEMPYKRFLNSCEKLSGILQSTLLRIDSVRHPDLGERISSCIASLQRYDYLSAFNNKVQTRLGQRKAYEADVDMLNSHEGEPQYRDSNSLNLYVSFWLMIQGVEKQLDEIGSYMADL